MKKIYSFIGIAAIAALALSCEKNNIASENLVTLSVSTSKIDTKAHFDVDGNVYTPSWDGGENMYVWFKNPCYAGDKSGGQNITEASYYLTAQSAGATTTFSGTVPSGIGSCTLYPIVAPRGSITKSYKGNLIRVDLPNPQTPVFDNVRSEYSYDPTMDVLFGEPTQVNISTKNANVSDVRFSRVTSVMRFVLKHSNDFELKDEQITSFEVESSTDRISGMMQVGIDGIFVKNTSANTDGKNITTTLDANNAPFISNDGLNEIWLVASPGTITSGSTLTIKATADGKEIEHVATLTKDITLKQGGVSTLNVTFTNADIKTSLGGGGDEPIEYDFGSFTQNNGVATINPNEDITITLNKQNGGTNPTWNGTNSEARLYAKGSLTIEVKSGYKISKIVYSYVVNANNKGKTPTIDSVAGEPVGNWDEETKTWTGSSRSVTLSTSGDAGNIGFTHVSITYAAE